MKSILVTLFTLISIFFAPSSLADEEISLYRAESRTLSLGGTFVQEVYIDVRVENIAFEKRVTALVEEAPGTWVERSATFLQKADENFEIWRIGYNLPLGISENLRFALKFETDGGEYWDNNGGYDYYLDDIEGVMLGSPYYVVANKPVVSISTKNRATYNYSGSVLLKNLDVEKAVTVVYSTDNWATVKETDALYSSGPNFDGIERWVFSGVIVPRGSSLKFALRYYVAGVEYWDNNFGNDYSVSFTWLPPFP